jgi:tetratricopeptide (TPR) repeat protein
MSRALVLLALAISGPARAADETNREIARTYANFHLSQRDLVSAVSGLREHIRSDPDDAGAWNLLGIVYLQASQPRYAADAFQGAVSRAGPEVRGIYLYNFADARARSGDLGAARTGLAQAAQDPRVATAAEAALVRLGSGAPLPPLKLTRPGHWRGSVSLSSGYDTNVLLSSDTAVAEATGAASPSATTSVQAAHYKDHSERALLANGLASFTYHSDESARLYNSGYVAAGAEWAEGEDSRDRIGWAIGNELDVTFLNFNGFRFYNWNEGITPKLVIRHSPLHETELELPVRYQRFTVEDGSDLADDRTGFGVRPLVTYRRSVGPNLMTAGFQFEKHLARGTNYRANAFSVPLSWSQRQLFFGLWGLFELDLSHTRYYAADDDRTDRFAKAAVTLGRPLGGRWSGNLTYAFRRNLSSIGTYRYSKHLIALSVSHELF